MEIAKRDIKLFEDFEPAYLGSIVSMKARLISYFGRARNFLKRNPSSAEICRAV